MSESGIVWAIQYEALDGSWGGWMPLHHKTRAAAVEDARKLTVVERVRSIELGDFNISGPVAYRVRAIEEAHPQRWADNEA